MHHAITDTSAHAITALLASAPEECRKDINQPDSQGWTLLHKAPSGKVAAALIHARADLDKRGPEAENYNTPLHEAARHGNAETAVVLLTAGANHMIMNDADQTFVDTAAEHNQPTARVLAYALTLVDAGAAGEGRGYEPYQACPPINDASDDDSVSLDEDAEDEDAEQDLAEHTENVGKHKRPRNRQPGKQIAAKARSCRVCRRGIGVCRKPGAVGHLSMYEESVSSSGDDYDSSGDDDDDDDDDGSNTRAAVESHVERDIDAAVAKLRASEPTHGDGGGGSSGGGPALSPFHQAQSTPEARFLPYHEAAGKVQSIKLQSRTEYKEWCKSGSKPDCLPKCPDKVYVCLSDPRWGPFLLGGRAAGGSPLVVSRVRAAAADVLLTCTNLPLPCRPRALAAGCFLTWKVRARWLARVEALARDRTRVCARADDPTLRLPRAHARRAHRAAPKTRAVRWRHKGGKSAAAGRRRRGARARHCRPWWHWQRRTETLKPGKHDQGAQHARSQRRRRRRRQTQAPGKRRRRRRRRRETQR